MTDVIRPGGLANQKAPRLQTALRTLAAKGGGSEAKAKFAMLNPSDSIVEWVLKTVPTMGAGWCPPGILALGIGGTALSGDGGKAEEAFGLLADLGEDIGLGVLGDVVARADEMSVRAGALCVHHALRISGSLQGEALWAFYVMAASVPATVVT